jgi:hypothetical protein
VIPEHIHRMGEHAAARYLTAIENGATEKFAEMVASQTPPGTRGTDRAFMEGRYAGNWMDGMPPQLANRMVREARAAGINTTGRFYMGGLADKRAHRDPEAWVDSVDDVKRVAKKRRLEVHGIVDYVPPEAAPPKRVGLNPSIVKENVAKLLTEDPGMRTEDAVEKVKDRMTPHWKKRKNNG